MRSNSFETQEMRERDGLEEGRRVERLSHLIDDNNRRRLPGGTKGMQRTRPKKNYAETREVLQYEKGNFFLASGSKERLWFTAS